MNPINIPIPFKYLILRHLFKKSDDARDAKIKEPGGIKKDIGIRYQKADGKWGLLDVFTPDPPSSLPWPVIVNVHGGAWAYGTKETYRLYCMDMAKRGFGVISFNYVLAPKKKFTHQLKQLDNVLVWLKENFFQYNLDISNVFLIGDSAGAGLALQYAIGKTNPAYQRLFPGFSFPVDIKALSLACGIYSDLGKDMGFDELKLLYKWYLGSFRYKKDDPRYLLTENITKDFPPCFYFTAEADLPEVEKCSEMLSKRFEELGLSNPYKCFKTTQGNKLHHVFHCNIIEENAILANNMQADFLKSNIKIK